MFRSLFHPFVWQWFSERFKEPTEAQAKGWPPIAEGSHTLIAAPTGSGKTLAAFLWSVNRLVGRAAKGTLEDETRVLYVSPLKALGNDIERNLQEPLAGIMGMAAGGERSPAGIRTAVRSGDTPPRARQEMVRRPPHILITTPESLYILLTASRSREFLARVEAVIVDEIHAIAGDKRGSHLALSLERLEELVDRPLQRIGLSATQKPVEEIARLLVGAGNLRPDGSADCHIVDLGHRRQWDFSIGLPDLPLGPIATHDLWGEIYASLIDQIRRHRTTLVFVNTRRLVERVAHELTSRLGEGSVGAHHGSLSRKSRLEVEARLKSGELGVVVATASLELGIDVGHVDLVCQVGSPRTLNTLLQRVGRSGHWLATPPKGILYPLTRDDLVQCAAAVHAVRGGELDRVIIPEKPLDILAQQIVATVAAADQSKPEKERDGEPGGIAEEEVWSLVRGAYPYRNLKRREFDQLLEMLSEGIASRRGRRSAYLHRNRLEGRLKGRRGARLTAITNGGAIPDSADYEVLELAKGNFVGRVNEDFAIESLAGDIFLLGNRSWRIRRVSSGKVWVEDAHGLPPSIPFWLGEAPARTPELSDSVSEVRREVERRLDSPAEALRWLAQEAGLPSRGAEQVLSYFQETRSLLGGIPSSEHVVAERFFDEGGGMQLVLHAPFGGRINRAWGLALRKRFCVTFDREIQAAATDDGIVLSLGEQHSFPLDELFAFLRPATVEDHLIQAVLVSPMFLNRWRWNANRALALLRVSGGRKVPMAIQRMRSEDLLAAVFPEQVMCQDNRTGPIQVPKHPLVEETVRDCLHEAMDLEGLKEILKRIESGSLTVSSVDTPSPSPMSHEILNANPYAFLDDAPLEERRARAVSLRRIDPQLAQNLGALGRDAIALVRAQAWPEIRDADELHDLLLDLTVLPEEMAPRWTRFAEQLLGAGRARLAVWQFQGESRARRAYVAVERMVFTSAALTGVRFIPDSEAPSWASDREVSEEEGGRKIVQGWMERVGPITAGSLSQKIGMLFHRVERSLYALEASGLVLRGTFTSEERGSGEVEWCDRDLLARIHRLTLGQLRREIEPVSPADYMRFLLAWQRVAEGSRLQGREGVAEIIGQLQGLELPAPSWEQWVLPARLKNYEPSDLENLCLAGVVAWGRLRSDGIRDGEESDGQKEGAGGAGTLRRAARRNRAPTRVAPLAFVFRDDLPLLIGNGRRTWEETGTLSDPARDVARFLQRHGASFLGDIARGTGLLKSQAEEALWELVAAGLVTGDGIAGLRVLLTPEEKRKGRRHRLRVITGGRSRDRLMPVGRWALWPVPEERVVWRNPERSVEFWAGQLLRRYGVVFREILSRESCAPPWRKLLDQFRILEARGEVRGGRFIGGLAGEQYALPEAVDRLRLMRRSGAAGTSEIVAAADPLNLLGILTAGPRVSPLSGQVIVYRDGVAVDTGSLGAVRSRLQRAETQAVDEG